MHSSLDNLAGSFAGRTAEIHDVLMLAATALSEDARGDATASLRTLYQKFPSVVGTLLCELVRRYRVMCTYRQSSQTHEDA